MSLWHHQHHQDYWELGHKVSFAPQDNLVVTSMEVSDVSFVDDIYSAWKEWLRLRDNSKYIPAARATGGDPIPGTANFTGTTVFMTNGWRVLVTHGITYDRNAFSDDFPSPFVTAPGVALSRHKFSNLVDTVGSAALQSDVTQVLADTQQLLADTMQLLADLAAKPTAAETADAVDAGKIADLMGITGKIVDHQDAVTGTPGHIRVPADGSEIDVSVTKIADDNYRLNEP